ncbi:DUF421 domain-containing protein [Paenibacillus sp. y28]|uniref:DUF421 domain-containing protein n=1 Tax=Paenibacillus sp. y28 TaxID=3129110 RepID=UPI0030159045
MEYLAIFLRTLLIYIVIFLTMRLMGKREIGKLSVFDLVISFMIAEIGVIVIEDWDRPFMDGVIPIVVLMLIQVALSYLTLKSQKIRNWFDGKPSFFIREGKLDRKEMRKQRYNLDDLMVQLRENKVPNVADVEFAILEASGKLSVVEKSKEAKESGKQIRFEGLPLPLIMDGKVQDDNLLKLGQTRFWLKHELQQQGGPSDFKDVFFCSIDHRGKLYISPKLD